MQQICYLETLNVSRHQILAGNPISNMKKESKYHSSLSLSTNKDPVWNYVISRASHHNGPINPAPPSPPRPLCTISQRCTGGIRVALNWPPRQPLGWLYAWSWRKFHAERNTQRSCGNEQQPRQPLCDSSRHQGDQLTTHLSLKTLEHRGNMAPKCTRSGLNWDPTMPRD